MAVGATGPSHEGTAVLVHGLWGSPSDWTWVAAALEARGWDVRTPDLPSHRAPDAGLAADAEAVRVVVRGLRAARRPVVLVGWSYGGTVATVASWGDAPPDRLVHVAALPEHPRPGERRDRSRDRADHVHVLDDGTCVLDHEWWTTRGGAATFPAHVRARLARRRPASQGTTGEPIPVAGWHDVPTTVLLGRDDTLLPRGAALLVPPPVDDVRQVDCDHFLPFRLPDLVAATVAEPPGPPVTPRPGRDAAGARDAP
ncbi:alpha/beta hydrolase family protein [Cellulomonas endophytica]|uniref:alpha/beta hydrolase family protein n=1 Tax=Cellulomonas endophytica TaxID=2494735 RepID=UPI0010112A57|nr:alpha/beta hydrolase family protein [Cellulomonas endophytica]